MAQNGLTTHIPHPTLAAALSHQPVGLQTCNLTRCEHVTQVPNSASHVLGYLCHNLIPAPPSVTFVTYLSDPSSSMPVLSLMWQANLINELSKSGLEMKLTRAAMRACSYRILENYWSVHRWGRKKAHERHCVSVSAPSHVLGCTCYTSFLTGLQISCKYYYYSTVLLHSNYSFIFARLLYNSRSLYVKHRTTMLFNLHITYHVATRNMPCTLHMQAQRHALTYHTKLEWPSRVSIR